MNDINQRLAENIETVLCLNLQDRYAYGDLLHTNQIDVIPEEGVKEEDLRCIIQTLWNFSLCCL